MNMNTAMSARTAIAATVPNEPDWTPYDGRVYAGGGYMDLIGTYGRCTGGWNSCGLPAGLSLGARDFGGFGAGDSVRL